MKDKKIVLHILSSNRFSGAENVACQIIKMLDNEYEMYYCCPKGSIEKKLKEEKIKYIGLDKLTYKNIKKVVNELKPDIIHAHDVRASAIASRFSKKTTIISHIHGNHKSMNKLNLKTALYLISSSRFEKIIWVSNSALKGYRLLLMKKKYPKKLKKILICTIMILFFWED